MSDIPFSVEVHTVYQEKTLSAFRKVIEDKQLYYAPKVKLWQELCEARTVDVHVRRLREKIEETPAEPKYIHTKWGVGYYFQA